MLGEVDTERPVVVAIGGNSLLMAHQVGTIEEQRENALATCEALADLAAEGHRLVITHGNGPQVGNVLLRVELAADRVYTLPLDICDSDTQGGIGYMLQQILGDGLEARGLPRRAATVVTQVVVDRSDPAFAHPDKPIGAFLTREVATEERADDGHAYREIDSRGFRMVVPSPKPLKIVELDAILALFAAGIIPICVGGGGIPVCREGQRLLGCEAVIDKDRASSLLAQKLGAETLVITTGVDNVLLDYEQPTQRAVSRLSVAEAKGYLAEGQFGAGTMGPKIEACIGFLEAGGRQALVTSPDKLRAGLQGQAGTWIVA